MTTIYQTKLLVEIRRNVNLKFNNLMYEIHFASIFDVSNVVFIYELNKSMDYVTHV